MESDWIYFEWSVKFEHKINSEEIFIIIDPGFHICLLDNGMDFGPQTKESFFIRIWTGSTKQWRKTIEQKVPRRFS